MTLHTAKKSHRLRLSVSSSFFRVTTSKATPKERSTRPLQTGTCLQGSFSTCPSVSSRDASPVLALLPLPLLENSFSNCCEKLGRQKFCSLSNIDSSSSILDDSSATIVCVYEVCKCVWVCVCLCVCVGVEGVSACTVDTLTP